MSDEEIVTIEDMEKLFYSQAGQNFLSPDDLVSGIFRKDAPVTTGVTGVYNAVYGAQAWIQINMEANTLGILAKLPWGNRSGWRVISAATASFPYGGVAENAALGASVKPTFAEVSTKPKTMKVVFENSEIQEALAASGTDDAFASMSDLRTYFAAEHKKDMNGALNQQNGTTAGYNFYSVDTVVTDYDEVASNKESDQSTAYTANDCDMYGLDRDTDTTWQNAYVSMTATSGTMRTLTESLLHSLLQNTISQGANHAGQVFQTGLSGWSAINQIWEGGVRYNIIGTTNIKVGVNGIMNLGGQAVGLKVAEMFDCPVIQSADTVTETSGISRIYLFDTSNPEGFDLPRLCLKVIKPTQYFEAGMNQGNPFAVNTFSTKGLYRTCAELICTFFRAQGKIRDLSA